MWRCAVWAFDSPIRCKPVQAGTRLSLLERYYEFVMRSLEAMFRRALSNVRQATSV